jgi:adenylate cyclase
MSMEMMVLMLVEFANAERERRGQSVVDDLLLKRLSARAVPQGGRQLAALPRQLLLQFDASAAASAVAFAERLLADVEAYWQAQGGAAGAAVRVVMGAGAAAVAQGRVQGDWVHRLAGLLPRVPANGIAAFDSVLALDPALPSSAHLRRLAGDLFLLHPHEAEGAAETRMASPLERSDALFTEIVLRVRGTDRRYRAADSPLLIGRSSECTVQVAAEGASRQHGRIVYEKGRFYYQDDSRNGTWALTGSGEEVALRQDRMLLTGEGALSLGAPIGQQTGELLRFVCRSQRLRMDADNGDTRPLGS